MNKGLTKDHTKMLHGLAILMMLYHHLFSTPEALGTEYVSVLNFGSVNIELKMAWFFKICVAIYAFTSGYGLSRGLSGINVTDKNFRTRLKDDYVFVLKKYVSFYLQYLLVFIIFVPIGFFFFDKSFVFSEFLLNLLGISSTYNGAWWYVLQYLKMILTLPVLDVIFAGYKSKKDKITQTSIIIAGIVLVVILRLAAPLQLNNIIDFMRPAFYLCFVIGFLLSRFRVYELMDSLLPSKILYALGIAGFLIVIILRVMLAKDAAFAVLDFLFVPVFSFGFICITETLKPVKPVFLFFGKLSTYIWLTHVFFYDHYAKKIVMASHISTLIYLTLLLLSTLTAFVLNYIGKHIFKRVN